MKYKLVKLMNFSGDEASVYSVYVEDLQKTLFDVFLEENKSLYKSELKVIIKRLRVIGMQTGARNQFFKLKEGSPGDGVSALYDEPDKKLRLYCIKYGTQLVILGGGGEKPGYMKALQESAKLTQENTLIKEVSASITKRIKEGEIKYVNDFMDFEGNLEFNTEEDE